MCQSGASIASCRFRPRSTWRRKTWSAHCSCWSPPGVPAGEPRLAVAQHEARRERRPRPLARRERRRETLLEPEHLRAGAERPAERRDHRRALQPAAARRRRDQVAEPVGDVEVHGVAARRLAGAERRRGAATSDGSRAERPAAARRLRPRRSARGARRRIRARGAGRAAHRRRRSSRPGPRTRASRTRSSRARARLRLIAPTSNPSSSASCCSPAGPCPHAPVLQTVRPR